MGVGAAIGGIALFALVYWLGRRHARPRNKSVQQETAQKDVGNKEDVSPPYELSSGGSKKIRSGAVELETDNPGGAAELYGDEKRRVELDATKSGDLA